MADRPIASTSREGRPRMRSQSVHLSSCTSVTPRTERHRTTSEQRSLTKGKGAGKGKKASKKSNKPIEVVSSDSEDLKVDFPNYHQNQPHEVPAEIHQEPNPPANAPVEEQQEQEPHIDAPIEELHHLANVLVGDAEEPQNPGNLNLIPAQPPILMANNQLNWSHFRPEFSGKLKEDGETCLLRTEDWMTTHNFPEDQKVGIFCLTLTQKARLWYATLNAQQQQLTWEGLQDRFRQQYSKFGSTREQYFLCGDPFNLIKLLIPWMGTLARLNK